MKYDRLKMTDEEKVKVLEDFGMEVTKRKYLEEETWFVTLPLDAGEEPPFYSHFGACGAKALNLGLSYIEHQEPIFVETLLARGAQQLSRKYRMVAVLPEGMTAVQALKERSPKRYEELLRDMEQHAQNLYRQYVADEFGDLYTLTLKDFNEFLSKTGRQPNTFLEKERTPCPGCSSLGHHHRPDCSEQKKKATG